MIFQQNSRTVFSATITTSITGSHTLTTNNLTLRISLKRRAGTRNVVVEYGSVYMRNR